MSSICLDYNNVTMVIVTMTKSGVKRTKCAGIQNNHQADDDAAVASFECFPLVSFDTFIRGDMIQ